MEVLNIHSWVSKGQEQFKVLSYTEVEQVVEVDESGKIFPFDINSEELSFIHSVRRIKDNNRFALTDRVFSLDGNFQGDIQMFYDDNIHISIHIIDSVPIKLVALKIDDVNHYIPSYLKQ